MFVDMLSVNSSWLSPFYFIVVVEYFQVEFPKLFSIVSMAGESTLDVRSLR